MSDSRQQKQGNPLNAKPNKWIFLREWAFNILVAAYYAVFVRLHALYFWETGSPTTLLFIVFESLIILLALTRRMPREVSFRHLDWIAAGIGTYLPLMMISKRFEFPGDVVVLGLQLFGILVSFIGMCSLNRSYGTVPANRGVRSSGLYRWVRHPIYAGYFLSLTCFVIQNVPDETTRLWNPLLLVITLAAMVFRIRFEEALLMKDPEYAALAQKTRYRLIPGIW